MARQPAKYTAFVSHLPASVDTISRRLILLLIAVFTVVAMLLVHSALWSNAASTWMRLIIVTTALVAYFRPRHGLLMLGVLVPVSQVIGRMLDSQLRAPEALVLAFLAGALIRGWTLRELRTFPATRLDRAALIFGLVVAASCVEQIWLLQIQSDFAGPFLLSLLDYSIRGYFSLPSFGMVYHTLLFLEGLALLVYASHVCRRHREYAGRLAVALVLGGVAASMVNIWYFARHATRTTESINAVLQLMQGRRWTAFVADLNAAGSFFAMTLILAIGAGLSSRSRRGPWLLGGVSLAAALWLTASRTAIAAVVVTAAVVTASVVVKQRRNRTATIAVACILVLGTTIYRFFPAQFTGSNASTAVTIRWLFLQTTSNMLEAEPLFGVGIGQYRAWSREYAPPELLKFYVTENAHNNFAQVAGELGLIGLVAFVGLLAVALVRGGVPQSSRLVVPTLSAVAVFVLTWLGGHPLLVPEVTYPFWLLLGLGSALVTGDDHSRWSPAVCGIALVLLATSMPLRVGHKAANLDMTRIRYGISDKGLMAARGRLFVPADKGHIELPLRSRLATHQAPVEVDVLIDRRVVDTVTMVDDKWQTRRIQVPNGRRLFQPIDLQLRRPGASEGGEGSARRSVEIGDWSIISKPHG